MVKKNHATLRNLRLITQKHPIPSTKPPLFPAITRLQLQHTCTVYRGTTSSTTPHPWFRKKGASMKPKAQPKTITPPHHLRSPATSLSPPKRSPPSKKRSCCTLHVAFSQPTPLSKINLTNSYKTTYETFPKFHPIPPPATMNESRTLASRYVDAMGTPPARLETRR